MKELLKARLIPLIAALTLITFAACENDDDDEETGSGVNANANDASKVSSLARLEFPKVKGGNSVVIIHSTNDQYGINYSVEWDKDKKSQRWSCYQLNSMTCANKVGRYTSKENQYPMDPDLPRKDYLSKDCYWNSGFEHGHICPSYDRRYNEEAQKQTFYLTNMQPQYSAFNGGDASPWYQLEGPYGFIRNWAAHNETEMLYIVKGGTIDDDKVIQKDGKPYLVGGEMRVPKYFFVALLLKNDRGYKAIGFWMEHKNRYSTKESPVDCAVNIRELERLTGIDFFCNLPDDIEERVETLPIENVKRTWGL